MKLQTIITSALLFAAPLAAQPLGGRPSSGRLSLDVAGTDLIVTADIVLDSLRLGADRQIFVTPVVSGDKGEEIVLPSVLVNGRNMHYAYLRGSLKNFEAIRSHDILTEVRRQNGTRQNVEYTARTPLRDWMRFGRTRVRLVYDSCACGVQYAPGFGPVVDTTLNPFPGMRTVMITPPVTDDVIIPHEGRARVQFEVDKTVLHDAPYRCKNGQLIDNRAELKVIDDTVSYALSDPNVEISGIRVCGYASPESPYLHNEELATGRSRALAEYLADKYRLPREKSVYSSVPENWGEFRDMVVDSKELTARQRADLLELIDRPCYGPSDYDAKERELKTSPKFAKLYKDLILPVWFPKLRATTFAIETKLKPMSDRELAKVIETNPKAMTLNQMFRVARLYPEGSDEFNKVIAIALEHYGDDPVANLNAAVAAYNSGDIAVAKQLLEKAGDSPEANNLRGIIATRDGDFAKAAEYFGKCGSLPEAVKNLNLLK